MTRRWNKGEQVNMVEDFLATKTREIQDRITELEPLVVESERLRNGLTALEGVPTMGVPAVARARKELALDRPRRRRAKRQINRRLGPMQQKALDVVNAHPEGISASAIATELGVTANSLYSGLNSLVKRGHVHKRGMLWLPR